MKRVCGWCRKDMGRKEPLSDPAETTGMCEACIEVIKKEIERNAIGETPAQREGDQGTAFEGHGGAAQTLPMTVRGANPAAA